MKDFSGQKFNKVTILSFSHMRGSHSYWNCRCDCGKEFKARADCVQSGNTKSCGCLVRDNHKVLHGQAKTKLYHVYYGIIQRCCNPNTKRYEDYGGRGISICDEWKNDYMTFYKWSIENGYKEKLSIDRIDVNGNYEPSNCRWVTQYEQNRNTRRNTWITINGKTMCLKDWCNHFGVDCATACSRIKRGWTLDRVFGFDKGSVSTNCSAAIGTQYEAVD